MKLKLFSLSMIVLLCATITLTSCRNIESLAIRLGSGQKQRGHGPPPHAPAHGYRHKRNGLNLTYDSGLSVYVVIGFPSHYYYKGHYYRFSNTQWQISTRINGSWESVSEQLLPAGLKAKGKSKGKSKDHPGRGRNTGKNK